MAGMALPIMISAGRSGVTSICSKVPSSRSRAKESAATIMPISIDSTATRPGSTNHSGSSVGLNQSRVSITSGGGRGACSAA